MLATSEKGSRTVNGYGYTKLMEIGEWIALTPVAKGNPYDHPQEL